MESDSKDQLEADADRFDLGVFSSPGRKRAEYLSMKSIATTVPVIVCARTMKRV
jgi:hypothetical protein